MLTLEYSDAAGVRRRIIGGGTDLVVGRAPMCDVVIDDVSVSRTHARLRADNGRLMVTDLGSRNGTIVDGVSVRQAELQPGAIVAFGGVPVRVSSATEDVSVSENHVLVDAPETFLQPARDLGNNGHDADSGRFVALISQVASLLVGSKSLDHVLESIMALAFEHLPCERGFLLLGDDDAELRTHHARNRSGERLSKASLSRTILKRVLTERMAMLAADAQVDSELRNATSLADLDVRSFICAPLSHQGRLLGVLYLDNPHCRQFTRENLDLLVALSGYAAVAVDRARVAESLAQERRRRERLQRYHSPAVLLRIIDQSEEGAKSLIAQERDATVLLTDIVGFTTLAERMAPPAVADLLNRYFERMVEVLFRHEGTLDKFTGDGLLAIFNAPMDQSDHAQQAVAAATEMHAALDELNRTWEYEPIAMRVGVNSGRVIVGDVGSSLRREYTVLGDVVNTCARIVSEACRAGQTVIGHNTREKLGRSAGVLPIGRFKLRGRREAIDLFEVCPLPSSDTNGPPLEPHVM